MLFLANTTDKLQLTTGTAADVDVHVDWIDATTADPPVPNDVNRTNTAITTATTTDILAAPAASTVRKVKHLQIFNKDTADSTDVTVVYDQNGTDFSLYKANLAPGEALEYNENIGFFKLAASPAVLIGTNKSTAAQGPGFATDTYLTGSNIPLAALGAPIIGTLYDCSFSVSKTGAGTATPIIQVRVGTAGTTSDTSRLSFTFSAGTAATDVGWFRVFAMFRAVGASAVLQGHCGLISQPTTGFSTLIKNVQTTSGAFDSTVANSIIGVSVNGGASASWTVQLVEAEIIKR
jgi:hypothetical protein